MQRLKIQFLVINFKKHDIYGINVLEGQTYEPAVVMRN